MSDLSKLLGNVYGTSTAPPQDEEGNVEHPSGTRADAPDWADEDVLDRAFEDWVAGPPEEASSTERSMLADLADGPPAPPAPVDEERVEQINRIVPLESLVDPGAVTVDPADEVAEAEVDAVFAPQPEPGFAEPEPTAREATVAPVVGEPAIDNDEPETGFTLDAPVEVEEALDEPTGWERSQDDILPRRSGAKSFLRRG